MKNLETLQLVLDLLRHFTEYYYKEVTNKNYWVGQSLGEIIVRQGCFVIISLLSLSSATIIILVRAPNLARYSVVFSLLFFLGFVIIDSFFSSINYKYSFDIELQLTLKEKETAQIIYDELTSIGTLEKAEIENIVELVKLTVDRLSKKEKEEKEVYSSLVTFMILGILIILLGFPKFTFILSILGVIGLVAKLFNEYTFSSSSIKYIHWISILNETQKLLASLPK